MKIIASLILLLCLNVFAGDLNLVCEDKNDELTAIVSVDENQQARTEFIDADNDKYYYYIDYNHKNKFIRIEVTEANSGLTMEVIEKNIELFEIVNFVNGNKCLVRD